MERHEDAVSALYKFNLDDVEKPIHEAYHQEGPGRPPRSPLGIFKALMAKRLGQLPSDRELYRRLWNDSTLRMIRDIEKRERPYHPSPFTRFQSRVGPEKLESIIGGPPLSEQRMGLPLHQLRVIIRIGLPSTRTVVTFCLAPWSSRQTVPRSTPILPYF